MLQGGVQELFGIPGHTDPARSELYVWDNVGTGSINTTIPYFKNVAVNTGSAFIYYPSTTYGDSVVIKEPGLYFLGLGAYRSSAGTIAAGFSQNVSSALLSAGTTIANLTYAQGNRGFTYVASSAATNNGIGNFFNFVYCSYNDVIRAHFDGSNQEKTDMSNFFRIVKITR